MIDSKRGQHIISVILTVFSIIGFSQLAAYYISFSSVKIYYMYSYTGLLLISLIGYLSTKSFTKRPNIFYVFRFIELHFISFLLVLGINGNVTNIANVFLFAIIFIVTTIVKGNKSFILVTGFTLVNLLISMSLGFIFKLFKYQMTLSFLLDLVVFIIFAYAFNIIIKSYGRNFWELEQAHVETKKANELLNESVAELSTLQEISRFSNSVLNLKELINLINDMIIGVMGVNYCSIFLIDDSTGKFYLEATNIPDKNTIQNIKMILASKYLPQLKSSSFSLIEKNTNDLKDFPAINSRNVKNCLITTLQSHRNILGIIFVESCFEGVFEQRKKNMITTICNQVSIAIENAVIYDKMERLATIDGLTQVHNRRYFNETILSEFSGLQPNTPVCIAMSDIDNFKKVNDTYGHLSGDSVLKTVASIIKNTVCASDSDNILVARYGGEEFVILFRNTDLEMARTMLEVVRKNIESAKVEDDGQIIKFSISIGVAEYPSTSSSVKDVLRDADNALYTAKQTGKNKVVAADKLDIKK